MRYKWLVPASNMWIFAISSGFSASKLEAFWLLTVAQTEPDIRICSLGSQGITWPVLCGWWTSCALVLQLYCVQKLCIGIQEPTEQYSVFGAFGRYGDDSPVICIVYCRSEDCSDTVHTGVWQHVLLWDFSRDCTPEVCVFHIPPLWLLQCKSWKYVYAVKLNCPPASSLSVWALCFLQLP